MAKSLRLSETWFRRGLWLVALVFAGFLMGLGGTLVGDLPKVESHRTLEDYFADRAAADRLRAKIKESERQEQQAMDVLEQARLKHRAAQSDTQSARETFNNWLATRRATQLSQQDPELVARTHALDDLRQAERAAQSQVEQQEQAMLDARQAQKRQEQQLNVMVHAAELEMMAQMRRIELRVFLYRLALTLPLLAIAGWLFKTKRQSTYWPFVWGFILFALFAFFVELVPYLPSYGGYVRYIVGIVVTVVVGRQAIVSLNRYLERQRLTEQMPDAQRREEMSYDQALVHLAKSVCPGCERPVDLKNDQIDFCSHCGIGVFDHCSRCDTRKSAFAKFCHSCGTAAGAGFTRLVSGPAGTAA